MRRNSFNKKPLSLFWRIIFFFFYQIFTSFYLFLSPLIGVIFCYIIILKKEEYKNKKKNIFKERYFVFACLTCIELIHGFYLFSIIFSFLIAYYFLTDWFKSTITCEICIIIFFVIVSYFAAFGMNNLIAYILNADYFKLNWEYALFVVTDIFVSYLLFRGRIQ